MGTFTALKKAVYGGGSEATSIAAMKGRIKEKAQSFSHPTILFNTVNERLAVCARDSYWAVQR